MTGHCGGDNAPEQWHTFCGPWQTLSVTPRCERERENKGQIRSLLKHNGWPARKVLFSYDLAGARVRCCHDEVISLTHRTSGRPESHSSVCKETAFCSPNPHHHHSNASTFKPASYIQKGLRTFDDAWQFFASIHAEWLCVGDCEGWMEPCVWRRWGGAELGAGGWVTAWNRCCRANGEDGWGWGGEGATDWGEKRA